MVRRVLCKRNRVKLAAISSMLLSLTACIGAAMAQSRGTEAHGSTLPEWVYVAIIGALVTLVGTMTFMLFGWDRTATRKTIETIEQQSRDGFAAVATSENEWRVEIRGTLSRIMDRLEKTVTDERCRENREICQGRRP